MAAEITNIYCYLVHPGKLGEKAPAVMGTEIPLKGSMFQMLKDIYGKSESECNIPINFAMNGNGEQVNQVRNLILDFLKNYSLAAGFALGKRLQTVTTARSGLGLLFLTVGKADGAHKLILSRFPANQGIIAETQGDSLAVEFVERVFMKNAHAYKSVLYKGSSFDGDFWDGRAVDRQIGSSGVLANYWIRDFLESDFKITAKEGTKQLARALKDASVKLKDYAVKQEIIAATQLAKNLKGQVTSISDFARRFSLSKSARDALIHNLPNGELAGVSFQFDPEEFSKHAGYMSKELDSGAILTAAPDKFEECFKMSKINNDELEFVARGKIINQRIKNRKI